jgi:hypothetical protein|tara:strand:+ start:138 stop:329 length:192 start_codon:yes stop_codon:yes gene_type:complete
MAFNIDSPETYSSESSLINAFWSSDNTKTIEDIIQVFTDVGSNRNDVISSLKSQFVNINDWSV